MRLVLIAATVLGLSILPAAAADAPAKGISQSDAVSRIAAKGFSSISGLTQDASGVWHGKAVKSGDTMDVTVGTDGKVTAK
jgi:hypothetical protein